MSNVTRREFLRRLAAAGLGTLAGNWLLSACGKQEIPTPTSPPPTMRTPLPPTTVASATRSPTAVVSATSVPTAAPSIEYPHLAVTRGGEPEQLVRRAIAALGGMERFVRSGDDVIIKPNICLGYHAYEYAATTNPWVVAELVRLCLEAGARRVRVMDSPFGSGPEQAYVRSGIQEQALAAGGQMEMMTRFKFVPTEIPEGRDLRQKEIYEDVLKADVLINVPIAKHHNLARLTLGMKNLMGVITDRPAMHRNLGQRLADLTSRVRPDLTVVDAVRILLRNGPTGGSLDDVKKLDTVIASPDIVAADSYAATLFGQDPQALDFIRAGTAMGLGRSDLDSLKIEEIAVGT
jgi:uncharacterized protein (DUF362 family)